MLDFENIYSISSDIQTQWLFKSYINVAPNPNPCRMYVLTKKLRYMFIEYSSISLFP